MPHCNKQMISFFLTTKCNLCCEYCYNQEERTRIKEHTLPLEIAKAGIDWYFANNASRHIRFYGPGEPMIEFELLKNIVEYAHSIGGDAVTTEIQTNGIFGEKERKWCLNNFNIIWMSFDGLPEIQNKYRPLNRIYEFKFSNKTSAEIIEDNVRWLNNNAEGRNIMVGARVTMTDENIKQQKEMVDYFHNLGIRYVWTNPLFHTVGHIPVNDDPQKKKEYKFDMDEYLKHYLNAYRYANVKGMFWGSFLTINFDGESTYHCRACTPTPHLTPDGYLSACDMVLLGEAAYHMNPFIYGKWNTQNKTFDLFNDKVKALNERKTENISHCKNCEARLQCGGYCLGEVLNETGRLDGQKPESCIAIKKLLKKLGKSEPYKFLHP